MRRERERIRVDGQRLQLRISIRPGQAEDVIGDLPDNVFGNPMQQIGRLSNFICGIYKYDCFEYVLDSSYAI